MRPQAVAALVALFVCATALAAAEVPVSDIAFGTPPGERTLPAVRAGRNGSLTAWVDQRGTAPAVYATRLDSAGLPLDPHGIALGEGHLRSRPQIVWNGRAWLVFWTAPDHSMAMARVEENGTATAPRRIAEHAPPEDGGRSIVTNGSIIVAVHGGMAWGAQFSKMFVTVMTMDGDVISSRIVDTRWSNSPIAVAHENGFAVAWTFVTYGGPLELQAIRLDSRGIAVDETPRPIVRGNAFLDFAGNGEGYVVIAADYTESGPRFTSHALDRGLNPASVSSGLAVQSQEVRPFIIDDGGRAVFVMRETSDGATHYAAVRFDDQGHESGRQRFLTSPDPLRDAAIERSGAGFVAAWIAFRQPWIWPVRTALLDPGLQPLTPQRSLSVTAPPQAALSVAAGANEVLVAWREEGKVHLARFAFDGSRLPLEEIVLDDVSVYANVALVFDGERYVVAYVTSTEEVAVRFLEPRGSLRPERLEFEAGPETWGVTLARGRSSTLIGWRTFQDVHAASIAGTSLLRVPRVIASGEAVTGVAAASNGEHFLVVWQQGRLDWDMFLYDRIMGLRLNEDLSSSMAEPRLLLNRSSTIDLATPLVARGSQWFAAIESNAGIDIVRIDAEGNAVGTTPVAAGGRNPRLASDGRDALLEWTSAGGELRILRAAALNADGTLGPERIALQSQLPGDDFGYVSAAALRSGTAILAYSRRTREAGSVWRAFVTLERSLPTPPRRRSVR